MSDPLVSIILPTFNGSRYMEKSVESCISQTYSNWELIVVDDCSTDQTPDIIKRYVEQDHRISYFRHEKNKKLPGGLNTGFELAKGEYLTWTSDDNCYRPNAISTMVEFLEKNVQVDIVYTNYSIINELGAKVNQVEVGQPSELAVRNCIGACFLYKRKVQEQLGGYAEDLFLAEDYDFWLRASISFQLKPLHQDLYLYRIHPNSLTNQQRLNDIRKATIKTLTRNLPKMKWLGHQNLAQAYLSIANTSLQNKELILARKYAVLALMADPHFTFRNQRTEFAILLLGQNGFNIVSKAYQKCKRILP